MIQYTMMTKGQWEKILEHSNDTEDHCDLSVGCRDTIILPNDKTIKNSGNIIIQNDERI